MLASSGSLIPISTTRTVSPYLSPKKARYPASSASVYVSSFFTDATFRRTCSFTSRSTSRSSSDDIACMWVKSNRSRSGDTDDPACRTWEPSTRRSAS